MGLLATISISHPWLTLQEQESAVKFKQMVSKEVGVKFAGTRLARLVLFYRSS
jgi:hypothetical protein